MQARMLMQQLNDDLAGASGIVCILEKKDPVFSIYQRAVSWSSRRSSSKILQLHFRYDRRHQRYRTDSSHNMRGKTDRSFSNRHRHRWSLLLLVAAFLVRQSSAGWIDPDTPEDAHFTTRLNVKAPPREPASSTSTSRSRHRHRHSSTSSPPSESPTLAPTNAPSSPPSMYPTFSNDKTFELVFSDEFNVDGRSFSDGSDPRWTALDKNDYTNDALHYYTSDAAVTKDGMLHITTKANDTDVIGYDDVHRKKTRVTKHFQSAMLQTWNKFCFTGGIIEASVQMPGKSSIGGLWPAFWLLGNLARHTYVGSSEHIWPWSSSKCVSASTAQLISACDRIARYDMPPFVGRGSPEIDIFEVQPGSVHANQGPFLKSSVGQPFMSSSYQVAPGRSANRPGPGEWPGPDQWYSGLMGGRNTSLNIGFYGTYNHFLDDVNAAKDDYWSDAISMNRQLTEEHFNSSHTYRLEWDVPSNETDGYLHWYLDNQLVYAINGTGLEKEQGPEISSEPSYIILNTAVSKQWGFPRQCPANCPCKEYNCKSGEWQDLCGFSEGFCNSVTAKEPPVYKIDWVRVYQDPTDPKQKVGCSTPERPTRKFIVAHADKYKRQDDEHPLRGVPVGNGNCHSLEDCGGLERGRCTPGHVCECRPGLTGPHCKAAVAYDDVRYDEPDSIADVGFIPPRILPRALWCGLVALAVLLCVSILNRHQLAGWEPIPNVDKSHMYRSGNV